MIDGLTYSDLDSGEPLKRQTYLWSLLFASGYLTDAGEPAGRVHKLIIPNREILEIYKDRICTWFEKKTVSNTKRWQNFCEAVKNGDRQTVQILFNSFMEDSISIRDTYIRKDLKEIFYHGMLLGLIRAEDRWILRSNAESGTGYTDIMIIVPLEKTGCIIEVKYAENGSFEAAGRLAAEQITDKGYETVLRQEGMQTIHKFAIACYKKSCRVYT